MATNALPAGYALQEYRIEKVLGVGGFGLTYLALDGNLNLKVAVKEYLPDDIATRGADNSISPRAPDSVEMFGWGKQRFLDESRVVASFRHPNIVRVMRFFEANGTAYMVMEFVEGAALNDWIRTRPAAGAAAARLDRRPAARRAGGGAQGGLPAPRHQARQHLYPRGRQPGAARLRRRAHAHRRPDHHRFARLRAVRAVPQQGQPGPWSDLYALGGVLYWMITGNKPHEAAARIKADTMPSALQSADRALYRSNSSPRSTGRSRPTRTSAPSRVAEWRESIAGTGLANTRTVPAFDAAPRAPAAGKSALTFDAALLKKLDTALAQHLGPIAPVVVRNAAKKAMDQAGLVRMWRRKSPTRRPRPRSKSSFPTFPVPPRSPPALRAAIRRPRSPPAASRSKSWSGPRNAWPNTSARSPGWW
jgi:serine/threonine protein kinase